MINSSPTPAYSAILVGVSGGNWAHAAARLIMAIVVANAEPGEMCSHNRHAADSKGDVTDASAFQFTPSAFRMIAAAAGNSFFALQQKTPSVTFSGVQPSVVLTFTSAP